MTKMRCPNCGTRHKPRQTCRRRMKYFRIPTIDFNILYPSRLKTMPSYLKLANLLLHDLARCMLRDQYITATFPTI